MNKYQKEVLQFSKKLYDFKLETPNGTLKNKSSFRKCKIASRQFLKFRTVRFNKRNCKLKEIAHE